MKQLNEFLGWVNSVSEFERTLTEAKGHLDHPEDLVFLGGSSGANRAVDSIVSTVKDPKAITIKWDGYPALIFGHGPEGKFSIMDKHMFNKKDMSARNIHSPQDFIKYDASRGAERSGLHSLIKEIWPGLEEATKGSTGYFWGDLLFSNPLQDENGLYKFKANPNGITYTVDANSETGKLLAGKKAGIAVHQQLDPNAASTDQATSLGGSIGPLKSNRDVAIVPSKMPITPFLKVDGKLLNKAKSSISKNGAAVDDLFDNAPMSASAFQQLFTTFINKRIVEGNLSDLVAGFIEYLSTKPMSGSMHQKLFGTESMPGYIEQHKDGIIAAFEIWIDLYNLKMNVVEQLNKAAEESPVKGYLQSGKQSQEGFVSQGLKFVDRSGFSAQNLAGRTVKEDVNTGQNTLVIYPGGFHPFHLGHASVYQFLEKQFPTADVYVAATDTTSERPFNFIDKKFLAGQAGVPNKKFVKVKSPYRAEEITKAYDPNTTVLIFAVSVKDADRFDYKNKKDGSPSYFQPLSKSKSKLQPMNKHAYIAVVPKIDFSVAGKIVDSASMIRKMYGTGDDNLRSRIAQDLYPDASKPDQVKAVLDKYLTEQLDEADNPNYFGFGGGSQSAIPGTPPDLMPQPSEEDIQKYHKEIADLKRFMGHRPNEN